MKITPYLEIVPDNYHGWRVIHSVLGEDREGQPKFHDHITYHAELTHAANFCLERLLATDPVATTLVDLVNEISYAREAILQAVQA